MHIGCKLPPHNHTYTHVCGPHLHAHYSDYKLHWQRNCIYFSNNELYFPAVSFSYKNNNYYDNDSDKDNDDNDSYDSNTYYLINFIFRWLKGSEVQNVPGRWFPPVPLMCTSMIDCCTAKAIAAVIRCFDVEVGLAYHWRRSVGRG
jgi:hypothetical protein